MGGPGAAGCKGCHLRAGAQPLHWDSIGPTSPRPAPRAPCSGDRSTRAAVKGTAMLKAQPRIIPPAGLYCWLHQEESSTIRQGLQEGLSLQGHSLYRAERSWLG